MKADCSTLYTTVISFSDCDVTITQPFGVITSPGFPQNYRNGINCTWYIQLFSGQLIQINFLYLDIEPTYTCSLDSLTIYDGCSIASPLLGNPYCGYSMPPSQISSSNHLFIHFHSNYHVTRTGFKVQYSATSKNQYKVDSCILLCLDLQGGHKWIIMLEKCMQRFQCFQHKRNNWHLGQLKKLKSWGPFGATS